MTIFNADSVATKMLRRMIVLTNGGRWRCLEMPSQDEET